MWPLFAVALTARAAGYASTPFDVMFWSPFSLVAALAHSAQTADGAKMRWWQADEVDMNETLNEINNLLS